MFVEDPYVLGVAEEIKEGFDPDFYVEKYGHAITIKDDPTLDYAAFGYMRGWWPRADFCPTFYIFNNEDLMVDGLFPFLHYVQNGKTEGRAPSTEWTDKSTSKYGLIEPYFDTLYYVNQISESYHGLYVDWIDHYLLYGWKQKVNACRLFDSHKYLFMNLDIWKGEIEPLSHYLEFGMAEGRTRYKVGL